MSGMEKCVNPKCVDYTFLHPGMCALITEREEQMKHTLTLNLMGVTRPQLEGFLAATPEEAEFTTTVSINRGDRPWESDTTSAELEASWEG